MMQNKTFQVVTNLCSTSPGKVDDLVESPKALLSGSVLYREDWEHAYMYKMVEERKGSP